MNKSKNKIISFLKLLNSIIIKKRQALIIGAVAGIEPNAIETSNQLIRHGIKVYFIIPESLKDIATGLLDIRTIIVKPKSLKYFLCVITCKYIFVTHGGGLKGILTNNQYLINLWHGVPYKPIGKLSGGSGFNADFAIATSAFTQNLLSKAFDLRADKLIISGFPRNDIMFRAQKEERYKKRSLNIDFDSYEKVMVWVPTYRRTVAFESMPAGRKVDNPFQIEGFDIPLFNSFLKENNCLCILKPHPLAVKDFNGSSFENILFITDDWLYKHKITLYHLIAWCDIMISDFSSIIIDYLLLNKPIISFCTDLEEYKYSQGLYFDDINSWLPSDLIQTENDFYILMKELINGKDRFAEKRLRLRNVFFEHTDGNSSKRMIDFILSQ